MVGGGRGATFNHSQSAKSPRIASAFTSVTFSATSPTITASLSFTSSMHVCTSVRKVRNELSHVARAFLKFLSELLSGSFYAANESGPAVSGQLHSGTRGRAEGGRGGRSGGVEWGSYPEHLEALRHHLGAVVGDAFDGIDHRDHSFQLHRHSWVWAHVRESTGGRRWGRRWAQRRVRTWL